MCRNFFKSLDRGGYFVRAPAWLVFYYPKLPTYCKVPFALITITLANNRLAVGTVSDPGWTS